MTVSRHRRRMSTTRALIASIVGVVLAVGLGAIGATAIINTKDGETQGDNVPQVSFPATPIGAIAVLDSDDELASVAVVTVRPSDDGSGQGGTVVPIPVSADVSGGLGAERLPLDETVSLFGSSSLADELPVLLGVSIDRIAVVTEADLATALEPLDTDGAAVATELATRDVDRSGADEYQTDVAAWNAIADAVGDGLSVPLDMATAPTPGSTGEPADADGGPGPSTGDIVEQLTSGPISVQPLRSEPIISVDLNPRGVEAVVLDRVEVAVVFGHISPGRVAAPYPGYTFRVVSAYADDQLPAGVSRLDVAYTAAKALFGLEANVRSVATDEDQAEVVTVIEVSSDDLVASAETLAETFGTVEVRVAATRITGIDMIVTLGTEYLAGLDTGMVGVTTEPIPGDGESFDTGAADTGNPDTGNPETGAAETETNDIETTDPATGGTSA